MVVPDSSLEVFVKIYFLDVRKIRSLFKRDKILKERRQLVSASRANALGQTFLIRNGFSVERSFSFID